MARCLGPARGYTPNYGGTMRAKRISAVGLLVSVVLAGSGCASIVKGGGAQSISIRSMPSDAEVKIVDAKTGNTLQTGKTPLIVPLNKSTGFFGGAKYRVLIEKPGFAQREVIVDSGVNGWYVGGNLLFGGLIGWLIVDPATGAMWNLSPEEVAVELEASEKPAQAAVSKPVAALMPVMTMEEFSANHPELLSKLTPMPQ